MFKKIFSFIMLTMFIMFGLQSCDDNDTIVGGGFDKQVVVELQFELVEEEVEEVEVVELVSPTLPSIVLELINSTQ